MIELITGLPGNAKTLYAIAYVRNKAERENRPVYYSGIPELTLPWTQIEAEKWAECPPGSIIVIDECQRVFRNRAIGSTPPKFVTDLETHRHQGLDLIFITQHPMLIDPAVRRLTGRHRHMVRIWGMEASTVHEWPSVRENCDKNAARKDSEKQKWKFDKSVFGLYKSAEIHTMKRNIPMRVKLLFLVPILLAAAGFYMVRFAGKYSDSPQSVSSSSAASAQASALPRAPVPTVPARPIANPVEDARAYAFADTPRVAGLPQTAPKYDTLTTPTEVPVPAACVQSQRACQCFTQQATRMDVPVEICEQIVRDGFFLAFAASAANKSPPASTPQALSASPGSVSGEPRRSFASMPADGYGVLGKRGAGVRVPQVEAPQGK